MVHFSVIGKRRSIYRIAVFIMIFMLMFTTILPELSLSGSTGWRAEAATSDGNNYKVLGIMAAYQLRTTDSSVDKWKGLVQDRIEKQTGVTVDKSNMRFVSSREFNCLNERIVDNYDYVVVIVNDRFSHVGAPSYYFETQMRKDENEQPTLFNKEAINTDGGTKVTDLYKSVASGNDITGNKLKELKLFYDCKYPIEYISLGNLDTTENVEKYLGSAVEGNEKESNIAKLYKYTDGANAHIDGTCSADADNRIKNIRKDRVDLEITKSPTNRYPDGYANEETDTSKLLGYTFKIKDNAANASSKKYTAQFYLDMNNDGIFNEETEVLPSLGITLEKNGKIHADSNALEANKGYVLTVNANKYIGLVSWRLVISDNADPSHRFSYKDGTCKLHRIKGQEKEKLRIVQLTASPQPSTDSSSWTYNTVYLPNRDEVKWMKDNKIEKNTIVSMARNAPKDLFKTDITSDMYIYNIKDNYSKLQNMYDFYKYIYSDSNEKSNAMNDYDIYIDRVYVNNIDDVAGVPFNGMNVEPPADKVQKLYDYLTSNYDMIIVGFADCYDDVDSIVCDAIQAFIAEGKSVLFTHDTSSFVNVWKDKFDNPRNMNNNWGFNINKKMRNLLGMDRFGITLKDKNGVPLTKAQRVAAGKDYYNRENGANQDYDHGYSDPNIQYSVNSTQYYNGGKTGTNYKSYYADRINVGPVTQYPYEITEKIQISETHPQYYQLDLESDDIAVWYSMGESAVNNKYFCNGLRYKDGRNFYYIYNKGNITYSGVGNTYGLTPMEVKLFTNTMIASYRTGDSTLAIEETDWDAATTEKTVEDKTYDNVTLPVDYIKKSADGAYGESIIKNTSGGTTTWYKRVKFKVYDRTVAANKDIGIYFYTTDANGNKTLLNYFAKSIYRMSDGKVVGRIEKKKDKNGNIKDTYVEYKKLESGTEYYIYVPLNKDFNKKQTFYGEIVATVYPSGMEGMDGIEIFNRLYVNFNNRLQFNLG